MIRPVRTCLPGQYQIGTILQNCLVLGLEPTLEHDFAVILLGFVSRSFKDMGNQFKKYNFHIKPTFPQNLCKKKSPSCGATCGTTYCEPSGDRYLNMPLSMPLPKPKSPLPKPPSQPNIGPPQSPVLCLQHRRPIAQPTRRSIKR